MSSRTLPTAPSNGPPRALPTRYIIHTYYSIDSTRALSEVRKWASRSKSWVYQCLSLADSCLAALSRRGVSFEQTPRANPSLPSGPNLASPSTLALAISTCGRPILMPERRTKERREGKTPICQKHERSVFSGRRAVAEHLVKRKRAFFVFTSCLLGRLTSIAFARLLLL